MKFAEPYWLLVGLAACLLTVWSYWRFDLKQRTALTGFLSPRLATQLTHSLSFARRTAKRALVVAGVGYLFIALARPQAGYRWEDIHRQGRDILFAIDTSRSMLTPDIRPNRLTRAKLAVEDLLDKLDGDGLGLIAFAGNAFLQCPVTLDYDAFRDSLAALDTSTIPRGGTDIASAIREARAAFKIRADTDKILIVVSDGEDLGGDAIAAARAAAKERVTIFTVGVGSSHGDLIPIPGNDGNTEFVKDPSGNFVKSRLDEGTLRQIAGVTGGIYEPLGPQSQGLMAICTQGLARFARHDLALRRHKIYIERFEWPLLAGLVCFLGDWFIGTRRREPRVWSKSVHGAVAHTRRLPPDPAATLGLIVLLAIWPGVAHASAQSAEKAYRNGDFAKARQAYTTLVARKPLDARLQFNLGAAAYKTGDFAAAAKAYEEGLKTGQVPVQQKVYYNLGDAQYRLGQQAEKTNPQQTTQLWQQAVNSYDAALQIKPGDVDAKFNRDLVTRKLEQLKRQQQRQPPNPAKKQPPDKQNKDQQQAQQQQSKAGANANQQDQSHLKPQPHQAPIPQQPNSGQQNDGQVQDQNTASAIKPQPDMRNAADNKPNPSKKQPRQDRASMMANVRRDPGEMSPEEAKNLLNSLRDEERRLPVAPLSPRSDIPQEEPPARDW